MLVLKIGCEVITKIVRKMQKLILQTAFLIFCLGHSFCIAAGKEFPANLSDINATSNAPSMVVPLMPSNIKTPEYVIIRANEETTFSSETTGKVINLPVKEGSSFKTGDILLQLDCRLQEADLQKARAQQTAANKGLESAKKLKTYGSISEFEYIRAASEAQAANADVAKLATIVEKCTIIAPFSGGVVELKTNLYETVKPGDPLLKVTNTENLTAEIQVPSKWLSWLHIGSPVNIYINDIGKNIPAKVSLINPAIEPISQTVKITGQISSPEPHLRPGMTGQAVFPDNQDSR
jgi:RND family efflux transporter MFP subunit